MGVAGAGKSTALDAARRAFEGSGFRVLGTAISGQAARTLGTEAGIDEARTIASLLWRLDHGQLELDHRSVVVCDEAGMTDDPAMLRLLAATEVAGSKLVIIGDHRQIGAVGPGGSLEALISRHTGGVHVLTENVRQADPDERAVLAELRAGDVENAVNWYAEHHRVKVAPSGMRCSTRWPSPGQKTLRKEGNGHAGLAAGQRRRPQLPCPGGHGPGGPALGAELHVDSNVYQSGTGSSPSLPQRTANWSPPSEAQSSQSTPEKGSSRSAWTTGVPTPSARKRPAPTASPTATPRRSTVAKGPPSTPPTSSPMAVAASSGTWG